MESRFRIAREIERKFEKESKKKEERREENISYKEMQMLLLGKGHSIKGQRKRERDRFCSSDFNHSIES